MNSRFSLLIQFGRAMRKHRVANSLSQEEFAYKTGLHRTYVGAIERGERNITLLKVFQICKALNVNVEDFLRGIR